MSLEATATPLEDRVTIKICDLTPDSGHDTYHPSHGLREKFPVLDALGVSSLTLALASESSKLIVSIAREKGSSVWYLVSMENRGKDISQGSCYWDDILPLIEAGLQERVEAFRAKMVKPIPSTSSVAESVGTVLAATAESADARP